MSIELDLRGISENSHTHARDSLWWKSQAEVFQARLDAAYEDLDLILHFGNDSNDVGGGGGFPFFVPSVDMGAVHSRDLFGLDELIIFSFYFQNRHRYRRVVDLGANIGVHSGILAKLGYSVESYEPDPSHSALAAQLMVKNSIGVSEVVWHQEAVVPDSEVGAGVVEFVRVLGNTTSSHVKGAKEPYGALESFSVPAQGVRKALGSADLVKMDVEGLEADLLESLVSSHEEARFPDVMCEVGQPEKSERIFHLALSKGLRLYAQKINWELVSDASEMPTSYKEGSLFLTASQRGPWESQ